MTCAVIICSIGRPAVLAVTVRALLAQSRPPDRIILSVADRTDLVHTQGMSDPRVVPIVGPKGSCVQRNAGLDAVQNHYDTIVFMDDDYIPARGAVEAIHTLFDKYPDVVGLTGTLLADGIGSGGIDPDRAARMVAQPIAPQAVITRDAMPALYGCNMAFRASAIGDVRFDENMPLYGWQEDVDFSARITGRKIKTGAWIGVHCGVRAGREISGVRLGYSQIANPFYLWKKGSITAVFAAKLSARNMIANLRHSLRPEPWIDRSGRVRGNFRALWDILRGRSHPRSILHIPSRKGPPQTGGHAADHGPVPSGQAR